MSTAQHGPIRSFFGFIWSAINFTNHLVFNIIMLFVLLIIIALVFAGMSSKSFAPLKDKTALVLDLEGQLVEQRTADTISTAIAEAQGEGREIQLRDLITVIEAAKADPKISHPVLHTDGI